MIGIVSTEYVALLKYYIQSSSCHNYCMTLNLRIRLGLGIREIGCSMLRLMYPQPRLFFFFSAYASPFWISSPRSDRCLDCLVN